MTIESWAALAAWVGAAVAIASTVVTLWLQWWRRTRPEWSPTLTGMDASVQRKMALMHRSPVHFGADLTNVGDGAAFDVQVRLDQTPCEVIELEVTTSSIRLMPVVGAVTPGVRFSVVLPTKELQPGEERLLIVAWTAPPTRWGRRWEQALPLTAEGFGVRRPPVRSS